jgi:hypothetical protein
MKKCIGKMLVPIAVCFLIGHALGSASEPVRLFVKEVPLKVLGKDVTVIAMLSRTASVSTIAMDSDGI